MKRAAADWYTLLQDVIAQAKGLSDEELSKLISSKQPDIAEDQLQDLVVFVKQQVEPVEDLSKETLYDLSKEAYGKSEKEIHDLLISRYPELAHSESLLRAYTDKIYIPLPQEFLDHLLAAHPDSAVETDLSKLSFYDEEALVTYFTRLLPAGTDPAIINDYVTTILDWQEHKRLTNLERFKDIDDTATSRAKSKSKEKLEEIPQLSDIAYDAILETVELEQNVPFWAMTKEELQQILSDQGKLDRIMAVLEAKANALQAAKSAERAKEIEKQRKSGKPVDEALMTAPPVLVDIPTEEEVKFILQDALSKISETEIHRTHAARALELTLRDYSPTDPKLSADFPKFHASMLRNMESKSEEELSRIAPRTKSVSFVQAPYLALAEPELYTFSLKKFLSYRFPVEMLNANNRKAIVNAVLTVLQKAGFYPDTSMQFHLLGKENANKLLDVINTEIPAAGLQRVAKYFSLFKDYDVAGSSWSLDEGVKKIMRKPIDTEKSVREGGVWSFEKGSSVLMDGDDRITRVTILEKLANRSYRVNTESNIQMDVTEDKLFTPEEII